MKQWIIETLKLWLGWKEHLDVILQLREDLGKAEKRIAQLENQERFQVREDRMKRPNPRTWTATKGMIQGGEPANAHR